MDASAPRRLGYEIHAALIEDDLIVLDLARNLYLCAPSAAKAWAQAHPASPTPTLAELLNMAGLGVVGGGELPGAYQPPAKPCADIVEDRQARLSCTDVLEAAIATIDFWLNYSGRSLMQLITLAERGRQTAIVDEQAVRALAQRFERWIILAPVSGKCLVRSFMLLRYLQRRGHAAQWVFGVRTWPFRAHCWVQSGSVALDDAQERLIAYTPLLAASG